MDDTTRGIGPGDDFSGRRDEEMRGRATTERSTTTRSTANPAAETTRVTGRESQSSDLDPDSERRAREIEGEIASTRAELSETIDALQEKLRPGNLASEATERVKAVTTEKVRSMAETASGTARQMMSETRNNPMPALMIGAGVAWLLLDRTRKGGNGRHRQHAEWSDNASPRYGSYSETDDYYRSSGYRGEQGWRSNRTSSEGLSTEAISNWTREAAGEARQTARRAQNGLQRMMRQNPLLVGAAAMLVGAAVGAALPETEKENEWMGDARDTVVDKAQQAAQNATQAVKEAANEVVGDTVSKVAEKVTK
ncbi:MAG TPA: DUF3618 domain-containing protein [Vicinamibacterales bacterium]|nr:DUF3618 domain-containing protein [Vicinamibacterales bacterium]